MRAAPLDDTQLSRPISQAPGWRGVRGTVEKEAEESAEQSCVSFEGKEAGRREAVVACKGARELTSRAARPNRRAAWTGE